MSGLLLPAITVDADFDALKASAWTVQVIGTRDLPPLPIPTPPFFNVTRVWHKTTGTWDHLNILRDGVIAGTVGWLPPHDRRAPWTVRGDLTLASITVYVS